MFQIVFFVIVEQYSKCINKYWFRRILLSWILCCVIIENVYKTKITSLMITGPFVPSKTITNLADEGYKLSYVDVKTFYN